MKAQISIDQYANARQTFYTCELNIDAIFSSLIQIDMIKE